MQLVDTHAHLYSDKFTEDLDQVIERARQNHISKIILPNIDLDSIDKMHQLEDSNPQLFSSAMGIHPCDIKEDYLDKLKVAKSWFSKRKYLAVGEIGIDLYWDKAFVKEQIQAFKIQIEWAKELDLPIIIHARDSFQEIFKVLDEVNDSQLTGVLHCFTGGKNEVEKLLSYGGFKLGVGGVLTFKNAGLDKTLAGVSLDDLILETDSPYLAPTPYRGKRNESSYTYNILERLAEVKNETLENIANITSKNAQELFKFKLS